MKIDRELVKNKFGGKCAYCGVVLGDKWNVDHVIPVLRDEDIKQNKDGTFKIVSGNFSKPENHRQDNLYPACVSCNIHKGGYGVDGFRRLLQGHIDMLNKASNHSIYRHAKRFGLIQETGAEVVFHFEKVGE